MKLSITTLNTCESHTDDLARTLTSYILSTGSYGMDTYNY